MHQHVVLIAKLIANFLHSIAPTAISGDGLGSLGFGGIFDHAEAVYLVEFDYRCRLEVIWKSQKHAMLLLTVETLSVS